MATLDESEFIEYPNTFGKKVSYKLAHGGYTYSRRIVSDDLKRSYYYCDQRKICNASLIRQDGKWSYGKGTWEKNGEHTHHEPDNERCAKEIARGKAKLIATTDPSLTARQILENVQTEDSQCVLPNNSAIKQSLHRVRKNAVHMLGMRTSADRDLDGDGVVVLDSDSESEGSKQRRKRKTKYEKKLPSTSNSKPKIVKTEKLSTRKEEHLLFDSWGSTPNRLLLYTDLDNLKCTVQTAEGGITKVFITRNSEAEKS